MFSGGLLSRNIAGKFRSPAPDANQTKSIQGKDKNKPTGSNLFPKRAGDSKLINWCEGDGRYRRKFIREVNSRPTYTIQVPGNIKLLSPGGGIAVLGALFLIAGSVLTWLLRVSLCGPVGVGIGLFIILVATTLILENRNSSNKLVHVKDLYIEFAVSASYGNINTQRCSFPNNRQENDSIRTLPFCYKSSLNQPKLESSPVFCSNLIDTGEAITARPTILFPEDSSMFLDTSSRSLHFQKSPV